MQIENCYKLFTRSRSDPVIKVPLEKPQITRTPSHPPDFYIPVSKMHNQAPEIFRSCKLMKHDDKISAHTKTTFMMYDPLRVMDGDFSRPPKRFYRAFWKSVARKLVHKYRE